MPLPRHPLVYGTACVTPVINIKYYLIIKLTTHMDTIYLDKFIKYTCTYKF
jgi:hypothetical protein